jgi:probable HAF family extracellular repeat protein
MKGLGTLGGRESEAADINATGQVVGNSTRADGKTHAFLWSSGAMSDLGTLGGTTSFASSINSAGSIAGISQVRSGAYHATLWKRR